MPLRPGVGDFGDFGSLFGSFGSWQAINALPRISCVPVFSAVGTFEGLPRFRAMDAGFAGGELKL
jgi:hypothetical protein